MGAMTCTAMLVTLLLVATAASCHGADEDFLHSILAKHIAVDEATDDITTSSTLSIITPSVPSVVEEPVPTDDEDQQEVEVTVDQEDPKVKSKPKPKNSLMQRTRVMASRRRAQNRFRTGSRPNRIPTTPSPRNTTRWKPTTTIQPITISTTNLVPTNTSTTEPLSILTMQKTTLTTSQITDKSTEVVTPSPAKIPEFSTSNSSPTLQTISNQTNDNNSDIPKTITTRSKTRYRPSIKARFSLTQGLITSTRWTPSTYYQPTTISTITSEANTSSIEIDAIPLNQKNVDNSNKPKITKTGSRTRYRPGNKARFRLTQGLITTTTWKPSTYFQPTTISTITSESTTPSTEDDATSSNKTNVYNSDLPKTTTTRSRTRYRPGSRPTRFRLTQGLITTTRWKPSTYVQPTTVSTITSESTTSSIEVDATSSNKTNVKNSNSLTALTATTARSNTRNRPVSRPTKYRLSPRPRRTSTTLAPVTTSTVEPLIILKTQNTSLPTPQMTSTSLVISSTELPEPKTFPPTEIPESATFLSTEITESVTFPPTEFPESVTFPPTEIPESSSFPLTEISESATFPPTEITESPIYMISIILQNTLNQTNAYNHDSLTTTTTRSTTTTASLPTTEDYKREIETTEEAGHAGEVFLVEQEDITKLKIPKPLRKSIPKPVIVGSGLTIGVGLNIEDPEEDLEMLGPVLIIGNNLRRRRQHQGENSFTDETEGPSTDATVETTINPFSVGFEENDYQTDFETTLGPISFVRRTSSTAPPTIPDASSQNLTIASDTTIVANSETANNFAGVTVNDIISSSDFQEITVGTKVILNNDKKPLVAGEVIHVELENKSQLELLDMEHRSEAGPIIELDQTTPVSVRPERPAAPSIIGSIFNYFTQTRTDRPDRLNRPDRLDRPEKSERPRPDRPQILRPELPVGRPEERPEFRPFSFRPGPRPVRPDILPPRLSLRPSTVDPLSDFNTNRPLDELPIRSTSPPVRVSVLKSRPAGLNPPRPLPTGLLTNAGFLPSKPIIESGFQGIPGEAGESRPAGLFRPGTEEIPDYEYDSDVLPPSLPNLKIIPFVAADALGNAFRISSQEESVIPTTTTTTTTTTTIKPSTRRPPFAPGSRRPPILPPRRPTRPDTGRPSPFRQRPGTRPSIFRTTPRDKIISEDNSIAPSATSSPSRPLRFTSKRPFASFTPFPVEKTTELVQPEREVETTVEEITTDDLPRITSIESNTVNTPEAPLRLPIQINRPESPLQLSEQINRPEVPLRLPGPIRPIITSSQSSSVSSSLKPTIKTDDISNLFLQDIFGQPEGTKRPPVRFIPASSKPLTPVKTKNTLPEIPSIVTNLFPLAPDPIVAQGLLKLSGCNIYGRMYNIDDRISELSAECKECRCTPVGVQCLPVCA